MFFTITSLRLLLITHAALNLVTWPVIWNNNVFGDDSCKSNATVSLKRFAKGKPTMGLGLGFLYLKRISQLSLTSLIVAINSLSTLVSFGNDMSFYEFEGPNWRYNFKAILRFSFLTSFLNHLKCRLHFREPGDFHFLYSFFSCNPVMSWGTKFYRYFFIKNLIFSLEMPIYVLAFFIASLLSSKGVSFSMTSVVNNTFLLAVNVGKVTRYIDLKTLSLPNPSFTLFLFNWLLVFIS